MRDTRLYQDPKIDEWYDEEFFPVAVGNYRLDAYTGSLYAEVGGHLHRLRRDFRDHLDSPNILAWDARDLDDWDYCGHARHVLARLRTVTLGPPPAVELAACLPT